MVKGSGPVAIGSNNFQTIISLITMVSPGFSVKGTYNDTAVAPSFMTFITLWK